MPTNVLIPFYSAYGHTFQMAQSVEEGASGVSFDGDDTDVRLARVPEIEQAREAMGDQEPYQQAQEQMADLPEATLDDLRWADGIVWGTPTRYGNMTAQMKQFIDATGALWQNGELEDKATGVFTSTATIHGGQETTILTSLVPLLHLGMVFVGTPYGQNPHILTTDGVGGSPYGPSTMAGGDGSRQPTGDELKTARNLGERVAQVAARLKDLRGEGQAEAATYAE
jgi:NAD(P)H dehydrogenase (quinone)